MTQLHSTPPFYTPTKEEQFMQFAKRIAYPSDPVDYCQASMERLITWMEGKDLIVNVRGVRPQFHALNSVNMISFQNEAERQRYNTAWDRYLKEKQKAEDYGGSSFDILAQFTKFRQEAEDIRVPYMAEFGVSVVNEGKAAVIACNFKTTILHLVKLLVDKYNIPRSRISVIWGGVSNKVNLSKDAAKAKKIKSNDKLMSVLEDAGISLDDIGLENAYTEFDAAIEKEMSELDLARYDVGAQTQEKRQREIDRFQSGTSDICIFTFKSGGVGLSLHHTDEMTTFKCRRKPSGYVVESDIPSVPTKPRVTILTPTYSAIEMVQGLGRAPRITSLSNTSQTVVFYRGTIEERVAYITSAKLACLRKVVKQREAWSDVILGAHKNDEEDLKKELVKELPDVIADEEIGGDNTDE